MPQHPDSGQSGARQRWQHRCLPVHVPDTKHWHGVSTALLTTMGAATAQNTTSFSCRDYKSGEDLVFTLSDVCDLLL